MKVNEFLQGIEKAYNEHFPKSKCVARLSKNLYCNIAINCFLASDKGELSGGYWDNDMFSIRFSIDTEKGQFNKDITGGSEMPGNLRLIVDDKSYLLKPQNKHMAYDRKQLSFRKTKGDSKKLLKTLDRYFAKLKEELQKDIAADKIHSNYKNLLLQKLN